MLNPLRRRFMHLETQKHALLARLASFSPVLLSFRPAAQSWSALEVLDHLWKTEQAILEAVVKTLPHPQRPALKDRTTALLLTGLFLLPARVKAPGSTTAILPGPAPDQAEIEQLWNKTRIDFAATLEAFPAKLTPLGVFRHPVSGWMTMPQTLGFLSAHIVHHGYQLRRLERAQRRS